MSMGSFGKSTERGSSELRHLERLINDDENATTATNAGVVADGSPLSKESTMTLRAMDIERTKAEVHYHQDDHLNDSVTRQVVIEPALNDSVNDSVAQGSETTIRGKAMLGQQIYLK